MKFSILPLLLCAVGMYFLVKLRFFFVVHPLKTAGKGLRAIKDARAVRSFTLALAGTLGVGNVFGVAVGMIIGGAGSLFWLMVSMIFAMVTKYAEVVITSDNLFHDVDTHGGMFYVLLSSFSGKLGIRLSKAYALTVLLLSFVLGAALQSGAVLESVGEASSLNRTPLAIIFTLLVFISVIGETKIIEKITVFIIPLTTIIYIIMALIIIIQRSDQLGAVLLTVIRSALKPQSAVGGAIGFLFSAPVREGFSRGILSNEAGAGTSSMAHARSGVINPSLAGVLGIFEVWFDTGLICFLSGISILLSVPDPSVFDGGMQLVMYTFGTHFGSLGKYALLFCVFSFAFATVICWYYYGMESCRSLFNKRKRAVFTALFLSSVYFGCFVDSFLLVYITDVLMCAATALTVVALIKNSDRIKHLSEIGGIIDSDSVRIKPFGIKGNVFSKGERRR